MANIKNLEKGKRFKSDEKAREAGRRGGIASGIAKREKADLRRQLQLWMESEVTKDKNGNPLSGAEFMVAIAVKEASKGNAKFWELIRDTAGFKPVEKVVVADVEQSVIDEVENMVREAGNDK